MTISPRFSFCWTAVQLSLLLLLWLALITTEQPLVDAAFQERWFQTHVDHYNYAPVLREPPHNDTFPLRYFVDDQFFRKRNASNCSSILFYAGNEAPIDQFMKNSGFMLELAAELGSLVVFAEHRYYGQSMPFGTVDDSLRPGRNISFLTVEQAMQDFNLLNVQLRRTFGKRIPVIVFGGSYGANLALWLRLKNPNLWAGAIASSATPLKHLLRNTNGFARIETEVYNNVSSDCPVLVRRGWQELLETASDDQVQTQLGLCQAPAVGSDDRHLLHWWIAAALETMVQYGYPYPTEFYNPLPAYPFAEACRRMIRHHHNNNGNAITTTGLDALKAAADVYYNFTGQAGSCYNLGDVAAQAARHAIRHGRLDRFVRQRSSSITAADNNNDASTTSPARRQRHLEMLTMDDLGVDNSDRAWSYQTCTEVYQPMPTNGVTDFEVPFTPNRTSYYAACRQFWGVEPRPHWEEMTFMGSDIGTGSNLFLSNGQLDPWRAAGIQSPPNCDGQENDITVRTIENGAHHYDLRPSHELDPLSVRTVRKEQKEAIKRWITDWNRRHPPNE
jgi:pimeloyl-ACP methyl ester carboxylesterase